MTHHELPLDILVLAVFFIGLFQIAFTVDSTSEKSNDMVYWVMEKIIKQFYIIKKVYCDEDEIG